MSAPREATIQADILVAVTALPKSMLFRTNSGTARTDTGRVIRFNVPGMPDISGVVRGKAVGIEVKAAAGRQTRAQRGFQAAFEAAGGLYVLARSVDDVLAALATIP